MAIMGFGGGAMIGSPLATELMKHFATASDVGVAPTFVVMAGLYCVFMMGGALAYRVPPTGWTPAGSPQPGAAAVQSLASSMITRRHVHVKTVWRIPQFWLVWMVLCMNVSAGIGVLGMASPMLQEVFGGTLLGVSTRYADLSPAQLAATASMAAGFTALLSLFNIGGRFFWASLSDRLGRKLTYVIFFILGGLLYASVPAFAAYLADLFGTQMVGAIHGRLLTAWATAGILGPVVVNYMREYQLGLGLPREQVYNQTMYILVGMLLVGLVCNLLIRPVADRHFMGDAELATEKQLAHERTQLNTSPDRPQVNKDARPTSSAHVALAWMAVGLPLLWGVYRTWQSVSKFWM
jgi:MFS family permease